MRYRPVKLRPGLAASVFLGLAAASVALPGVAHADAASNVAGAATGSTDGRMIYTQVCQGCHMADAKGGIGAATIPALAGNPKLRSSSYPVYVVLNGYGAMPWFGAMLNDAQVAAVVNYVRNHFGNGYTDMLRPADVAAVRGPTPTMEK